MSIDTQFLSTCVFSLEKAFVALQKHQEDSDYYDICRTAVIKEFELVLEQTGKLLKKKLIPYFSSKKKLDMMVFKEIFKNAGKVSLLTADEVKRWCEYRDNRNVTTHDYGIELVKETLLLIPNFINDVKKIIGVINK